MAFSDTETVTRLLQAVRGGDRDALNQLFPKVYDALHDLARKRRMQWHGDFTVNTTALVHEAYLRISDKDKVDWKSRAHFYAVASKAMRQILINYAVKKKRVKRGGGAQKVTYDENELAIADMISLSDDQSDKLIALNEALKKLEKINNRQAQVVECKFFSKMTNEETGEALGISTATVKRDWSLAKAQLYVEIEQSLGKGQ